MAKLRERLDRIPQAKKERAARVLFLLGLAGAFAGLFVAVAALASLVDFCNANGGVVAGLQPKYRAAAQLQAGLGGNDCGARWRFQWWGCALQLSFLLTLIFIAYVGRIWKFKAALFATAAIASTIHMFYANELLIQAERTEGIFKTRGAVGFVGFCVMCAANIMLAFSGSALYEERSAWGRKRDPTYSGDLDAESGAAAGGRRGRRGGAAAAAPAGVAATDGGAPPPPAYAYGPATTPFAAAAARGV